MSETRHDRIRRMVDDAIHESVTADRLDTDIVTPRGTDLINRTKSSLNSKTLESYIPDEQPHFIFLSQRETPNIYGPEAPTPPSRPKLHTIAHVVTDVRWLMIAGHDGSHQRLSLPLDEIEATNYDTESRLSAHIPAGLTNNRIILKTDGSYYGIPVSNQYSEQDFIDLCGYLREVVGASPRSAPLDPDATGYTVGGQGRYEADRATLTTILDDVPEAARDEANELIRSVDDADALIRELTALVDEYEDDAGEKSLDELVASADDLDELRDELRTPVERQLEEMKATTDAGVDELKRMLRDTDPEEASQWALSAGPVAKPLMRYGKPGILASALLVLGSGIIGAYANTHEQTALDDIDPVALVRHADALAGVGEDLEEIDGELVGALLGASTYLGRTLAPEEYAHWITKADPEAILLGAERGAEYAHGQQIIGGHRSGALYGAGIGLAASYATHSRSHTAADDAFQDVVDSDLYKDHLKELAARDLDIE